MNKGYGSMITVAALIFMSQDIQIEIALSVDKVRVLIKILAESHMAFN